MSEEAPESYGDFSNYSADSVPEPEEVNKVFSSLKRFKNENFRESKKAILGALI